MIDDPTFNEVATTIMKFFLIVIQSRNKPAIAKRWANMNLRFRFRIMEEKMTVILAL
jgi:hypothetical protein